MNRLSIRRCLTFSSKKKMKYDFHFDPLSSPPLVMTKAKTPTTGKCATIPSAKAAASQDKKSKKKESSPIGDDIKIK